MTNLFISYRRDDTGGHAGRLSDRLIARFGADRIFMDVQDIQPGQNFQQAIERTLARCDCMLAVIGPRWIEIMQARRAQGEDFVRHEVSVALALGTTVIPVLVGGAKMPARNVLPDEMAAFSLCQAVEIRDNCFDDDAGRLVEFLARGTGAAPLRLLGLRMKRNMLLAVTGAVAAAALGVWLLWPGLAKPVTPEQQPSDKAAPAKTVTPEQQPSDKVAPTKTATPERQPSDKAAPAKTVTPERQPPDKAAPALDGEWVAELQRPGQAPFKIRLTLVLMGDRIMGTVRYPTGDGPILDGRYVNGQMTFRTSHVPQFESEPAIINYQARVEGDVIRLTVAYAAGVATGVAHRVARQGR